MNSAAYVDNKIANWKAEGLSKSQICINIAEACLGWPYVFGAAGALCDPGNRRSAYNGNINRHPAEAEQIKKRCQVLNGSRSTCAACKYYPNAPVRQYDCRGFTRWTLAQVGISIDGAGATSQWNTAANWKAKGEIRNLPDSVCCVFMQNQSDHKTMEHTGLYIGGGVIIHCSGEVKKGKPTDKGWTHWAIPVGMDGEVPPAPEPTRPTLRRGDSGAYVTLAQTKLIQLGYDLSPYGADGKFGAKTETAVKQFQADNGLKVDGVIGPATWAALDSGKQTLYTVTVQHVSKSVAESIIKTYGGTMTAEGD